MAHGDSSRRFLELVLSCERRLRDGYLGRAAALYGWGVALSYGLLMAFAPASSAALVSRALTTLAGVVGALVLLAGARELTTAPASDPLRALARETGTARAELWAARAGGVCWRLLLTAGRPALALATLAVALRLFRGET